MPPCAAFLLLGGINLGKYVVDTNTILSNPEMVQGLQGEIFIPYVILSELDRIKVETGERGYQARRGVRMLQQLENVNFDVKKESILVKIMRFLSGNRINNDDKIVEFAKRNNCSLVTGDMILQLKARVLGVEVIPSDEYKFKMPYTGYKRIHISDEELANFYSNIQTNKYDLLVNQYLLIHRNGEDSSCAQYRWNGSTHVELKLPNIKGLKAKNDLQMCALDLLNNDDVTVKIVCGSWGSGKTFLAMKLALQKILVERQYGKLLMVRSPYVSKDEQIGFLPGDKREKVQDFLRSLEQYIDGGEQRLFSMEQQDMIGFDIPNSGMKGLTISDTLIIADECEDFTFRQYALTGSRVGENSAIIYTGDWNQAEDKFKHNNALLDAVEKLKGDPLVGVIVLDEDVRSATSKVFMKL